MSSQQMIFIPLFLTALVAFAYSCYQRFAILAIAQPEDRSSQPGKRFQAMLRYAIGQRRVVKRPFGINHLLIFWSFLILLLANGEFLLAGIFPAVRLSLLPAGLYHPLVLSFELVSLLTLVCVALAAARRLFFAPAYLSSSYASARSGEAFVILAFIAALMLAFFYLHAAEIASGQEAAAAWMPVSGALAATLGGLSPAGLETVATVAWWTHALVLLLFMNLLPRSKHMHILTAIPNCFFGALEKPNTQPREVFTPDGVFGVGSVERFTWKDILDGYTCTECGRCQDVCPARATEKPLNPRQVVHDIKVNFLHNATLLQSGAKPRLPLIGDGGEGSTSEAALWSCTTCGACLQACPVLIEQMPKIVKMRRHLVEQEAKFPEELLNLFENMEQRSNPWGIAPSERTKWSTQLGDRSFVPGETEYLFFVGCAGAFDTRNKHVTVALATLLDQAGVSWGILGKDELCCGDSLRRLGNEYVFEQMALKNVELLKERGMKKIITQCPHCFSTLKNDYRQYGLELEVLHHSQLLADLVACGRLPAGKGRSQGKLLFHDSCYLGRHNDEYAAPRAVVAAASGNAPEEFSRQGENSFCCGAGGGRMWMEEHLGTRINLDRVREALDQQPETICVACPYCMTMFEDGLKDEGAETVKVRDIAEVLAEAIAPG
ncbi:heterodisulfide reductase-related iron-sulfur binding cluster [Desulfuromonas carbonis]|uniref:(Fe-S)-binding protein n=1 Tax=Desulfuromonas sp. DDH964 TaxID=1823759 RepID=UPI00078C92F6|nr:(Fe-S)-binding protein [Desulfuromonas sp. DDH964]AMV73886.1 electron transfer flavoprotein [Desulfuromonas sp. DDH964]